MSTRHTLESLLAKKASRIAASVALSSDNVRRVMEAGGLSEEEARAWLLAEANRIAEESFREVWARVAELAMGRQPFHPPTETEIRRSWLCAIGTAAIRRG